MGPQEKTPTNKIMTDTMLDIIYPPVIDDQTMQEMATLLKAGIKLPDRLLIKAKEKLFREGQ